MSLIFTMVKHLFTLFSKPTIKFSIHLYTSRRCNIARLSAIPDMLLTPLFNYWSAGHNSEQCVEWLKKEHSIQVSKSTVSARLRILRDLEIQARRDAITEKAAEQGLDYISMMHNDITKLNRKT